MTLAEKLRFLADRVEDGKEFYWGAITMKFDSEGTLLENINGEWIYSYNILNVDYLDIKIKPQRETIAEKEKLFETEHHVFHVDSNSTFFSLINEYVATDKIAQHKNLLNRLHETYKEKNHKYGDSFTDTIQKYGLVAGLSRMHDKFSRIENIILDKAEDDAEERLEDSLLDLANYCIMTVMAINETSKVGDDD